MAGTLEDRSALTLTARGRTFFWRTYTGAELDYVEERDGMLSGFEIKLQGRQARIPSAWSTTYPNDFGALRTPQHQMCLPIAIEGVRGGHDTVSHRSSASDGQSCGYSRHLR